VTRTGKGDTYRLKERHTNWRRTWPRGDVPQTSSLVNPHPTLFRPSFSLIPLAACLAAPVDFVGLRTPPAVRTVLAGSTGELAAKRSISSASLEGGATFSDPTMSSSSAVDSSPMGSEDGGSWVVIALRDFFLTGEEPNLVGEDEGTTIGSGASAVYLCADVGAYKRG
jgi:hypothetical protein